MGEWYAQVNDIFKLLEIYLKTFEMRNPLLFRSWAKGGLKHRRGSGCEFRYSKNYRMDRQAGTNC